MPVVVITKNTTPAQTPFGTVDDIFTGIEEVSTGEDVPNLNLDEDVNLSLGPSAGALQVGLVRALSLITNIPVGATIVEARLYMSGTGGGFSTFDTNAHAILRDWLPTVVTFNDWTQSFPWTTAGGLGDATDRQAAVDGSANISGAGYVFWDVTTITQDIVDETIINNGVGIFPVQPAEAFRFFVKSAGTDGDRPEWHVEYTVPAAGTVGGLLSGLAKSIVNNITLSVIKGGAVTPFVSTEITGWVYGHSLFTHTGFMSSITTTTGYWLGDISRKSKNTTGWKGAFGQLRDQVLPPVQSNQISYPTNQVDPWPGSPVAAWSTIAWDFILIMASNFEQTSVTPSEFVDESEPVLDDIVAGATGGVISIYEHWSEPAQYGLTVINDNELSPADYITYNALHTVGGAYHDWHLDYQDEMISRGFVVTMVPVGPLIADFVTMESYMSSVAFEDLYVDEAPHGNPTLYFLCGLICYLAYFKQAPATNYIPSVSSPDILPAVLNNLSDAISFFQTRLAFYGANGVVLP